MGSCCSGSAAERGGNAEREEEEEDVLPGGCSACAGLAQAPAVHTDLRGNTDTTETRLGNPWLHGEVTPGPAGHS